MVILKTKFIFIYFISVCGLVEVRLPLVFQDPQRALKIIITLLYTHIQVNRHFDNTTDKKLSGHDDLYNKMQRTEYWDKHKTPETYDGADIWELKKTEELNIYSGDALILRDAALVQTPAGEEFSCSVWVQCQPSNVRNLGSYWFIAALPV